MKKLVRELALFEHIERGHDAASIVHGMGEVTCEHGTPVVKLVESAFEGAPPVRRYADGCEQYGPYPERAPLRQLCAEPFCGQPIERRENARHGYGHVSGALDGTHPARSSDDHQSALYGCVTDPPLFPEGTPEYEQYATARHAELEKFAKGEPPYEWTDLGWTEEGTTVYVLATDDPNVIMGDRPAPTVTAQ